MVAGGSDTGGGQRNKTRESGATTRCRSFKRATGPNFGTVNFATTDAKPDAPNHDTH